MSNDVFAVEQRNIRGADSNSLLRLYDRAREIFDKSTSQQDRAKADKVMQRIVKELHKRKVPM